MMLTPTAAAATSLMSLIFSLWRASTKSQGASIVQFAVLRSQHEGGDDQDWQNIDPGPPSQWTCWSAGAARRSDSQTETPMIEATTASETPIGIL